MTQVWKCLLGRCGITKEPEGDKTSLRGSNTVGKSRVCYILYIFKKSSSLRMQFGKV